MTDKATPPFRSEALQEAARGAAKRVKEMYMTQPAPVVREWPDGCFLMCETETAVIEAMKAEHNAAIRVLRAEVEALTAKRDEARACLGAALIQVAPNDDKIIIEHLRRAYKLLGGKPR